MCRLRDSQPGDEAMVYELVKTVLAEYGLETNPASTDSDLQDIQNSYWGNGGLFRVLEANGRVVGSYGVFRVSPSVCELRKMYLRAEYGGRGFGGRMMTEAIDNARALGFAEMLLETNSCLKEGVALYRRFGFVECQAEHLSDRCDVAMRRNLA